MRAVKFTKFKNSLLFTIVLLTASGCKSLGNYNQVVAIVNGHKIRVDELREAISESLSGTLRDELRKIAMSEDSKASENIKVQILSSLIDEYLILDKAQKMGIKITNEEVEREIKKTFSSLSGGLTSYIKTYDGLNLKSMKEKFKKNLIIKKTFNKITSQITVSEQEALEYYNANKENYYQSEKVKAQQIVVKTYDKAKSILKLLRNKNSNISFEELAKKYSISPEGRKGGYLGYFTEDSVPDKFSICFKMREGEISKIVKSPYGYHIFKLIEKIPARQKTFDEVKNEIIEKLKEIKKREKIEQFVHSLRKNGEITVYENVLANFEIF